MEAGATYSSNFAYDYDTGDVKVLEPFKGQQACCPHRILCVFLAPFGSSLLCPHDKLPNSQ